MLPYMMSAKCSDFFTPPPCHCHKSADFVPFVCFLGTPLTTTADVIYGSPLMLRSFSSQHILCLIQQTPIKTDARGNKYETDRARSRSLPPSLAKMMLIEASRMEEEEDGRTRCTGWSAVF